MPCELPLTRPAIRVWVGALACFFATLTGFSAFLPMAFAALGSLDRQHRVAIEGRAGALFVVLHHTRDAQAPQHRHEPLAQALTAFAQISGTTQDHVLAFAQSDSPQLSTPTTLPRIAAPSPTPLPMDVRAALPHPLSFDAPALAPRPPPISALALVCLRSTPLRI